MKFCFHCWHGLVRYERTKNYYNGYLHSKLFWIKESKCCKCNSYKTQKERIE